MGRNKITVSLGLLGILLIGAAVAWLQAAPTLGPSSASPAYIVVNDPTPVLFTVRIDDPSVIATGVNLLKTDAAGKTIKTAGVMRDNGANGDAVGGDKIFSLQANLNEPAVGLSYYRVSAAFKGMLQRVLSSTVNVTIDPFALPPDPGEAGKLTLEGIDSDKDGVRDDLQRWIEISHANSAPTVAALKQLARSNQTFLVNSELEQSIVLAIADQRGRANGCLGYVAGLAGRDLSAELRARLLNTKERSLAYVTADAKLSGHSFPGLDFAASECDF